MACHIITSEGPAPSSEKKTRSDLLLSMCGLPKSPDLQGSPKK